MRSKILIIPLLLTLFASFCYTINVAKSSGSSTATLKITPEKNFFIANVTAPGSRFNVSITVENVNNLFAWQIGLVYNSSLLNFTKQFLPPNHVFAGKSYLETPIVTEPGAVYYGITLGPGQTGVNVATGTLCTLEFEILDPSKSGISLPASDTLHFKDSDYTFLLDPSGVVIPCTWETSLFIYTYAHLQSHTVTVDGNTFKVVTISNGEIAPNNVTASKDDKSISFTVTGPSGQFGLVNVTIPKSLLDGNPSAWAVYVNGNPTSAQIKSNATHTFVYVEFTFESPTTIKIKGTWIVPEFATAWMLLIPLSVAAFTAPLIKLIKRKK
jgi:hypothetical protein